MKKFTIFLFSLAMILSLPKSSPALIITFDDLSTPTQGYYYAIPDGYDGLIWNNTFEAVDATHFSNYPAIGLPYYFHAGLVSGTNVSSASASTVDVVSIQSVTGNTFDFDGAYFASVFKSPADLTLTGYNAEGVPVDSGTITITNTTPAFFSANWPDISNLTFTTSDSLLAFTMDNLNLTINVPINKPVPEPATLILLGPGMIVLAVMTRRKLLKNN
jgi:hypothetical protein